MSYVSQWSSNDQSPYEILGVDPDAENETIKKAFRKLALKHHPDRVKDVRLFEINKKTFQQVQQAYELLSDPVRRERYDEKVRRDRDRSQRAKPPKNTDSPYPSPPSSQLGSNGLSDSKFEGLKGFLNNQVVYALADTGADGNFVAERVASLLNMKTKRFSDSNRPSFMMAHGKKIHPIARGRATWKFAECKGRSYALQFFVLEDCIFDVMLGAEFVYSANLLSDNRHLFKSWQRSQGAVHIRLVKTCGSPRQRLTGAIRHTTESNMTKTCSALPDSAAEPNIVSYEYAASRGWLPYLQPSPPSCRLLQFIDGSIEETEGRLALCWRFEKVRARCTKIPGPGKRTSPVDIPRSELSHRFYSLGKEIHQPHHTSQSQPRRHLNAGRPSSVHNSNGNATSGATHQTHVGPLFFDVLRDCPWEIIVGHAFLDLTNAFVDQGHSFTTLVSPSPRGLNPIIWANARRRKDDQPPNVNTSIQGYENEENQLTNELEALALQFEEDRRLKRRAKYSNLWTSGTPPSLTGQESASTPSDGSSTISRS